MAAVGYLIELWLNLLSSNGGLLMLLINLLKGNNLTVLASTTYHN